LFIPLAEPFPRVLLWCAGAGGPICLEVLSPRGREKLGQRAQGAWRCKKARGTRAEGVEGRWERTGQGG
jgi:hypothetical protein